jgi:hypothetical protein
MVIFYRNHRKMDVEIDFDSTSSKQLEKKRVGNEIRCYL